MARFEEIIHDKLVVKCQESRMGSQVFSLSDGKDAKARKDAGGPDLKRKSRVGFWNIIFEVLIKHLGRGYLTGGQM